MGVFQRQANEAIGRTRPVHRHRINNGQALTAVAAAAMTPLRR